MKKLDLEEQFNQYLVRVMLNQDQMPEAQYSEVKKAFYGAAGQVLIEISTMVSESKGISARTINDMIHQVNNFWQAEVKKMDKDIDKSLDVLISEMENRNSEKMN